MPKITAGRPRNPRPSLDAFATRVARNVIRIRTNAGYTADDCAAACGCGRTTWYRIESGRHASSAGGMLDRIAGVLGVDLSELTRKPRGK